MLFAPETLAVARGDSLIAPAPRVPSVVIAGDSVLLSATEFEALLRAVAAGRRDTLVVRIDTSRAETAVRASTYAGRLEAVADLPLVEAHRRLRVLPGVSDHGWPE